MYTITWKYVVSASNQRLFSLEYGANGSWAKFFKRSEDYLGTSLYRLGPHNKCFTLIDQWKDRKSYERFLRNNQADYDSLHLKFRHLYEQEEKVESSKTNPFFPEDKEV